jgi:hypothetical protein
MIYKIAHRSIDFPKKEIKLPLSVKTEIKYWQFFL